ncbi:MAG: YDG domain-containing protein, partial [Syntrophobacteraceae bacterium]|nr:YDG domain-containing protein [Syntrophobacteraceae bacterium]
IVGDPTKVYDGGLAASLAGNNYSISTGIAGQGFTITQAVGSYNSPDVFSANTVTASLAASDFTATGGALASDYALPTSAGGAGTITPKSLTASIVGDPTKVYDGGLTASLAGNNYSISTGIAGQGFTITQTVGSYNSPDVFSANTVTASLAASDFTATGGALANDYALPTSAGGAGTITPATLTITANNAGKTFNLLPYYGGNGVAFSGFVNNENSSVLSGSLGYGGDSQGAVYPGAYTIAPSGLTSENYAITYEDGALTISRLLGTPFIPTATDILPSDVTTPPADDVSEVSGGINTLLPGDVFTGANGD